MGVHPADASGVAKPGQPRRRGAATNSTSPAVSRLAPVPSRREHRCMDDHALAAAALDHMGRMGVTLGDVASLLEHGHGLTAECMCCHRLRDLDLRTLVDRGYGSLPLRRFRVRCRACGGRGKITVRPPTPSWGGASWGVIR
jgi:hypothetical protein